MWSLENLAWFFQKFKYFFFFQQVSFRNIFENFSKNSSRNFSMSSSWNTAMDYFRNSARDSLKKPFADFPRDSSANFFSNSFKDFFIIFMSGFFEKSSKDSSVILSGIQVFRKSRYLFRYCSKYSIHNSRQNMSKILRKSSILCSYRDTGRSSYKDPHQNFFQIFLNVSISFKNNSRNLSADS